MSTKIASLLSPKQLKRLWTLSSLAMTCNVNIQKASNSFTGMTQPNKSISFLSLRGAANSGDEAILVDMVAYN